MVAITIRAQAGHELQVIFPRQCSVGLFQQHEGAGQGELSLPFDPVVAGVFGNESKT